MASADRLIEVFEGARNRAAGVDRETFIDQSCEGDPGLREQVSSLLEASDEAGDFMNYGSLPGGALLLTERPGDRIGRYKLLQAIGEGGCGVVYMAEQEEPVRRLVALKVIKMGMDTRQVVARFEAERQALALMDHPGIAKVFDAGATEGGRPFFVMELVSGLKMTDYCDRNNLPTGERLRLFEKVCHAIQHAHQKGVIHRDIKPSNILVADADGVAVPKVIDFGIAKATGQSLTSKTVFTAFEQFIGTPAYMSPEQATVTGADVDTRSDIYSLGVLLYELLTGRTPFDPDELIASGIEGLRRTIREEEPRKPSTRLSALPHRDLSTTAASRRTDPSGLVERVRGDLDWIVLKCLEKDRTRRYETVNGLARDIEHYLRDEPVLASPPSAWYRFRKLVRRHKGPVLAGSFVLAALVAGIIGTTWGMVRATNAEGRAVQESERKTEALAAVKQSEREKSEKLLEALIAQAQANRLTGRPGQRFDSLDTLDKATQLARSLGSPPEEMREIRTGLMAALLRPDLRFTRSAVSWPPDSMALTFDSGHERCARSDLHGSCSIRRVADDTELCNLPGLGFPSGPLFSPDGSHLSLRHFNKEGTAVRAVHIWRLSDPPQRILDVPDAWAVAFRGTDEVFLAYNDGRIARFALAGARLLYEMPAGPFRREAMMALHPTEPLVAVASYFADVIEVRNIETGEVLKSIPATDSVTSIAWHPDGRNLAVGYSEDSQLLFFDRETWQAKSVAKTRQTVTALAFNPEGSLLATVGWQGRLELFEVVSGNLLMTTVPKILPQCPVWHESRIAGGVYEERPGIWDVADGREFQTLVRSGAAPELRYFRTAVHPTNDRRLVVSMSDGFGIWDIVTRQQLAFAPAKVLDGHLLFDPSGNILTLLESGLARWPVKEDANAPGGLAIGPPELLFAMGRQAFSLSEDGRVIVTCNRALVGQMDRAGGWIHHAGRMDKPIPIDPGKDISRIAVSPDGQWVVTATHALGDAKLWKSDGSFVRMLAERGGGFDPIYFSSDSQWLSTSHNGGRVYSTKTWEAGPPLGKAGVFSPDGRLVAVQAATGVRLIEHTTGREIAMLEDPNLYSTRLNLFSLDGTRLISVNHDRGIYVWDLKLIRQQLKARGLDWE